MAQIFKESLYIKGLTEPLEEILKHMKVSMPHTISHYQQKYHISDTFIEKYKSTKTDIEINLCKPYKGIEEICKYIHKSDKHNYLYTHRGESAIKLLKNHGLYNYFTDFITSQNGFERKPSPNAINYLIDKHNMKHSEAIMIGDRDLDILSATNAGIHACLFTDENKSCISDYIINNFDQLYSILR